MTDQTIRGMVPLPDDPADDPSDEELLMLAVEQMGFMAASRGLHAVNVTLVEKMPTFLPPDDRFGRVAYFTAEAIAI